MSSTQAQNYHSINFGNKNTWDDWHLIPSSRPEFAAPKGRSTFVDIPGHPAGGIDITNINIAHPIYENRTGSFSFIAANDYGNWYDRYAEIRDYLHGKRMQAILDDDPGFYYDGRFEVGQWNSGKNYSTLEIKYDVDPYKRQVVSATEPWLWDPFNFETDIIQETGDISVSGEKTVVIANMTEVYAPYITASAQMQLLLRGEIFTVPTGRSRNPLIWLSEGVNTLVFRGSGTVTIEHRGGLL